MNQPENESREFEARSRGLELIRARYERALAPREAAELERALASDPELREFASDWSEVRAATEALSDAPPASRMSWATLSEAMERESHSRRARWRRAAAVAAALIGAAALWWALRNSPTAVRLQSIELSRASEPISETALPAVLATFRPVDSGAIRWLDDFDQALAVARAADRPVFLFGSHPTCPMCLHMKANALVDEGVVALVDGFVPVQIDHSKATEAEVAELFAAGWPRLEIYDASGALRTRFPGLHEAPEFVEVLSGELAARAQPPPPAWDAVQRAAADLAGAREHEASREFGAAFRDYSSLAASAPSNALAEAARTGLARIAAESARVVLAAREEPPSAARERLERSVAEFDGTPQSRDLAVVLERVREDGVFPSLVEDGR
jgi:hypothetical protein